MTQSVAGGMKQEDSPIDEKISKLGEEFDELQQEKDEADQAVSQLTSNYNQAKADLEAAHKAALIALNNGLKDKITGAELTNKIPQELKTAINAVFARNTYKNGESVLFNEINVVKTKDTTGNDIELSANQKVEIKALHDAYAKSHGDLLTKHAGELNALNTNQPAELKTLTDKIAALDAEILVIEAKITEPRAIVAAQEEVAVAAQALEDLEAVLQAKTEEFNILNEGSKETVIKDKLEGLEIKAPTDGTGLTAEQTDFNAELQKFTDNVTIDELQKTLAALNTSLGDKGALKAVYDGGLKDKYDVLVRSVEQIIMNNTAKEALTQEIVDINTNVANAQAKLTDAQTKLFNALSPQFEQLCVKLFGENTGRTALYTNMHALDTKSDEVNALIEGQTEEASDIMRMKVKYKVDSNDSQDLLLYFSQLIQFNELCEDKAMLFCLYDKIIVGAFNFTAAVEDDKTRVIENMQACIEQFGDNKLDITKEAMLIDLYTGQLNRMREDCGKIVDVNDLKYDDKGSEITIGKDDLLNKDKYYMNLFDKQVEECGKLKIKAKQLIEGVKKICVELSANNIMNSAVFSKLEAYSEVDIKWFDEVEFNEVYGNFEYIYECLKSIWKASDRSSKINIKIKEIRIILGDKKLKNKYVEFKTHVDQILQADILANDTKSGFIIKEDAILKPDTYDRTVDIKKVTDLANAVDFATGKANLKNDLSQLASDAKTRSNELVLRESALLKLTEYFDSAFGAAHLGQNIKRIAVYHTAFQAYFAFLKAAMNTVSHITPENIGKLALTDENKKLIKKYNSKLSSLELINSGALLFLLGYDDEIHTMHTGLNGLIADINTANATAKIVLDAAINTYVATAKLVDFDAMKKVISDNKTNFDALSKVILDIDALNTNIVNLDNKSKLKDTKDNTKDIYLQGASGVDTLNIAKLNTDVTTLKNTVTTYIANESVKNDNTNFANIATKIGEFNNTFNTNNGLYKDASKNLIKYKLLTEAEFNKIKAFADIESQLLTLIDATANAELIGDLKAFAAFATVVYDPAASIIGDFYESQDAFVKVFNNVKTITKTEANKTQVDSLFASIKVSMGVTDDYATLSDAFNAMFTEINTLFGLKKLQVGTDLDVKDDTKVKTQQEIDAEQAALQAKTDAETAYNTVKAAYDTALTEWNTARGTLVNLYKSWVAYIVSVQSAADQDAIDKITKLAEIDVKDAQSKLNKLQTDIIAVNAAAKTCTAAGCDASKSLNAVSEITKHDVIDAAADFKQICDILIKIKKMELGLAAAQANASDCENGNDFKSYTDSNKSTFEATLNRISTYDMNEVNTLKSALNTLIGDGSADPDFSGIVAKADLATNDSTVGAKSTEINGFNAQINNIKVAISVEPETVYTSANSSIAVISKWIDDCNKLKAKCEDVGLAKFAGKHFENDVTSIKTARTSVDVANLNTTLTNLNNALNALWSNPDAGVVNTLVTPHTKAWLKISAIDTTKQANVKVLVQAVKTQHDACQGALTALKIEYNRLNTAYDALENKSNALKSALDIAAKTSGFDNKINAVKTAVDKIQTTAADKIIYLAADGNSYVDLGNIDNASAITNLAVDYGTLITNYKDQSTSHSEVKAYNLNDLKTKLGQLKFTGLDTNIETYIDELITKCDNKSNTVTGITSAPTANTFEAVLYEELKKINTNIGKIHDAKSATIDVAKLNKLAGLTSNGTSPEDKLIDKLNILAKFINSPADLNIRINLDNIVPTGATKIAEIYKAFFGVLNALKSKVTLVISGDVLAAITALQSLYNESKASFSLEFTGLKDEVQLSEFLSCISVNVNADISFVDCSIAADKLLKSDGALTDLATCIQKFKSVSFENTALTNDFVAKFLPKTTAFESAVFENCGLTGDLKLDLGTIDASGCSLNFIGNDNLIVEFVNVNKVGILKLPKGADLSKLPKDISELHINGECIKPDATNFPKISVKNLFLIGARLTQKDVEAYFDCTKIKGLYGDTKISGNVTTWASLERLNAFVDSGLTVASSLEVVSALSKVGENIVLNNGNAVMTGIGQLKNLSNPFGTNGNVKFVIPLDFKIANFDDINTKLEAFFTGTNSIRFIALVRSSAADFATRLSELKGMNADIEFIDLDGKYFGKYYINGKEYVFMNSLDSAIYSIELNSGSLFWVVFCIVAFVVTVASVYYWYGYKYKKTETNGEVAVVGKISDESAEDAVEDPNGVVASDETVKEISLNPEDKSKEELDNKSKEELDASKSTVGDSGDNLNNITIESDKKDTDNEETDEESDEEDN